MVQKISFLLIVGIFLNLIVIKDGHAFRNAKDLHDACSFLENFQGDPNDLKHEQDIKDYASGLSCVYMVRSVFKTMSILHETNQLKVKLCIPEEIGPRDILPKIAKRLDQYPEELNSSAEIPIILVMLENFVCK